MSILLAREVVEAVEAAQAVIVLHRLAYALISGQGPTPRIPIRAADSQRVVTRYKHDLGDLSAVTSMFHYDGVHHLQSVRVVDPDEATVDTG